MLRLKGMFIEAGRQPGWRDAATECYNQSITMAHQQEALAWELRSATNLAALSAGSALHEQAKQRLLSIYGRFREGFETTDLRKARNLLQAV